MNVIKCNETDDCNQSVEEFDKLVVELPKGTSSKLNYLMYLFKNQKLLMFI